MKESARYAKIVEWSEEDQCYVGSVPGLMYGGCHGADETEGVRGALRHPATSGRDFANKMQHVA